MIRRFQLTLWTALGSAFPLPAIATVPACVAKAGAQPQIPGIKVDALKEREGEYSILRVEAANGAHMRIYYDKASKDLAYSRASCLGHQLNLLQVELGDIRAGAEWQSVVFSADPAYVPPSRAEGKPRWLVSPKLAGSEGPDPEQMLLVVIPHEQVHDFQDRADAKTPRWFAEGHATWMGTRISSVLQEGKGEARRRTAKAELADAKGPINLVGWGSVRPRREAIMRQVSPEDRARMETDPAYIPSGSFHFTSADFEGDDAEMEGARYGAALLVFEGLEERHGAAAVSAWANEVTSLSGTQSAGKLAMLVRQHFGEDLNVLLAEPKRK